MLDGIEEAIGAKVWATATIPSEPPPPRAVPAAPASSTLPTRIPVRPREGDEVSAELMAMLADAEASLGEIPVAPVAPVMTPVVTPAEEPVAPVERLAVSTPEPTGQLRQLFNAARRPALRAPVVELRRYPDPPPEPAGVRPVIGTCSEVLARFRWAPVGGAK
jgi:hypothetical protein